MFSDLREKLSFITNYDASCGFFIDNLYLVEDVPFCVVGLLQNPKPSHDKNTQQTYIASIEVVMWVLSFTNMVHYTDF